MARLARFLLTLLAALMLGAAPAIARQAATRHRELLPPGVREIDVRSSRGVVRRVADQAMVTEIVRWFDALPIAPSTQYYCPMIRYLAPTTFRFRSASGTLVAFAQTPGTAACGGSFDLTIRGRVQKPVLVGHFLVKVGRLLGLRLVTIYR